MKTVSVGVKKDLVLLHEQASNIETALASNILATNEAHQHIGNLSENQDKILKEAQTNAKKFEDSIESAMSKVSDEKQ